MSSRIFRNIVLTAVLSVLITAVLVVVSMYSVYENGISSDLKMEAGYIGHALATADDDAAYLNSLGSGNRITLIAPDGTVLFDSMADSEQMENHAERPEVVLALANGWGESTRNSDTLSEATIYYAEQTADGNIIRIASTRSSVWGAFIKVIPLTVSLMQCIIIASILLARRTAKRIVAPLNTLNLDQPLKNEVYDELAPLLTRMEKQRGEIRSHMMALENATSDLKAIMENMREGLVMLDASGKVLSINESAAQIFETDPTKAVGKSLLASSRDAELYRMVHRAFSGNSGDILLQRNDRHYQVYASPVMSNDTIRGAVLLLVDVTEHFAAEESRKEFTANVSHELKTPLTSISGFAEIIREGIAQPKDIPAFAGKICSESQRLINLVNDILQLSKLDEKHGLGQQSTIHLNDMLEDLIQEFSVPAQKKKLNLSLHGSEADIEGYPVLIHEMFYNLIDNAIKYTPNGGQIDVSIEKGEGGVRCSVTDTGIGIPREHLPHVFERFYRVDKSHSRATGGTGLGLAIVKHAAEVHNAQIELKSEYGQGTTVSLVFEQTDTKSSPKA